MPFTSRQMHPTLGFRLWDIELRVHWTFLLLLLWVFASQLTTDLGDAVATTLLVIAVFAGVVAHELGHAFVARRLGIRTRSITLYPIGGLARLERIPERPLHELAIAIAGPLTSLGLAVLMAAALTATAGIPAVLTPGFAIESFLGKLAISNLLIGVFNLLPAFPMDGGRVLRALLATRIDYVRATRLAATVGKACALVLAGLGALHDWVLIVIALFVFFGAEQETAYAEMRAVIRDVPVRVAMMTRLWSVPSRAPVASLVDDLLKTGQRDFPVVDDEGNAVGVLTHQALITALAEATPDVVVADAMTRPVVLLANQSLDVAYGQLESAGADVALVMDAGQLVGLLTSAGIREWALVHSDRAGAPFSRARPRSLPG